MILSLSLVEGIEILFFRLFGEMLRRNINKLINPQHMGPTCHVTVYSFFPSFSLYSSASYLHGRTRSRLRRLQSPRCPSWCPRLSSQPWRHRPMAEPPNLMPSRSARLPLDTKHSKENTKLLGPVRHTSRENPKIHIFQQDHKWENKAYIILNHFLHHF